MSAPNSKSIFTLSICLKTRWQNCPSFLRPCFFCFQIRHSVSSAKPTCSSQRNEPAMGFPQRFADDFQDVSKDKAGKPPSNLSFLRKKNPTVQAFTPGIQGRWMKTTSLHQTREIKKELSWKYYGKLMEILWTFSSDHISSIVYLVLSVHRKCCK